MRHLPPGLIALLLLSSCGRSDVDAREHLTPRQTKRFWQNHPKETRDAAGLDVDRSLPEAEMLEQLGYAEAVEKAASQSGTVTWDRERTFPGNNLIVSAHAPEVLEMTPEGQIVRRWRLPEAGRDDKPFRRAFPMPDGGLVAIREGQALYRFDAEGGPMWKVGENNHHDAHVNADGSLVSLTREARVVPKINPSQHVLDDRITWIDPDGTVQRHLSILDALRRSAWWEVVEKAGKDQGDLLHTNSIEVLDGRAESKNPAFKAGNVLLSVLYPSLVIVLDPSTSQVVWALHGSFHHQHDAELLPDGHLQLFDNHGPKGPSAVRVFDVASSQQVWALEGSPALPLFTRNCGSAELLPNGNRLIVESNHGRVIEVAPDGAVVWEWISPYRDRKDPTLVTNLYDVVRLPVR